MAMPSATIKFREGYSLDPSNRVDEASCTVHGVRILGPKSRNGRTYTAGAIRDAVPLYEGMAVYVDHNYDDKSPGRKRTERFGRLVNVREATGGLDGDFRYNPEHAHAKQFVWEAKHDPVGVGFSHDAEGTGTRQPDGTVQVSKITRVNSVDLVDGPATTMGLYEQETIMDPLTDPAAPPTPAPAETGTGGDDFRAKLADLAAHCVGDGSLDKATIMARLKSILNMIEEDKTEPDAEPADGDKEAEPKDDAEMVEQLARIPYKAARAAAKKLGVVLLKERTEKRRAEAVAGKVPAHAITLTFLEQLTGKDGAYTSDADAAKYIADRAAVSQHAKPRSAPPTGSAAPKTTTELMNELFGL